LGGKKGSWGLGQSPIKKKKSDPSLSRVKDIFMELDIQSDTQSVFDNPCSQFPGLQHSEGRGKQYLTPFLQAIVRDDLF
jgi:hypothetical protein